MPDEIVFTQGEAEEAEDRQTIILLGRVYDTFGNVITEEAELDDLGYPATPAGNVVLAITDLATGRTWKPHFYSAQTLDYATIRNPDGTWAQDTDGYNSHIELPAGTFMEGGRYTVTASYYQQEPDDGTGEPLEIDEDFEPEPYSEGTLIQTANWGVRISQSYLPTYLLKAGLRNGDSAPKPTYMANAYQTGHDPHVSQLVAGLLTDDGKLKPGLLDEWGRLKPGLLDDERYKRFVDGPPAE